MTNDHKTELKMSENTLRTQQRTILEQVANGTLSAEDGAQRLADLGTKSTLNAGASNNEQANNADCRPQLTEGSKATTRVLRIVVQEGGRKPQVNISIPLTWAHAILSVVPRQATDAMIREGISLEDLSERLSKAYGNGPEELLSIDDGYSKVRIWIE